MDALFNENDSVGQLDAVRNRLYVFGQTTISVIDLTTLSVTKEITMSARLTGLNFVSKTNTLYALDEDGVVTVINASTYATITTIATGGSGSVQGVYAADRDFILIPNAGENTVTVIATNINSVAATLTVGNSPRDLIYNYLKKAVYVSNFESKTISIISLYDLSVVENVSVNDQLFYRVIPINLTERVYSLAFPKTSFQVIADTNSDPTQTSCNVVIQTIDIPAIGRQPFLNTITDKLYIPADDGKLYVYDPGA